MLKKQFRQVLSCVLVLVMFMTFGIPSLAADGAPTREEALMTEIEELYASEPGLVGRTHKMQAFIMELALHAKTRNPDFKIIPQDGINLAFVDGDWEKGLHPGMMALIDGWGIEGMVGSGDPDAEPSETQQKYMELVKAGKYVSDTTSVNTAEKLSNYYARAEKWGIIPYPRIGGELAEQLFPGWRWASNGDYFWVDDPTVIGLGDRVDPTRDVVKLTDAQNYLYNINGRPYDAWETWDDEEAAAVAEGEDGDRARIYDSYGCGLLVPSEGGKYQPVAGEDGDEADVAAVKALYGEEWDWWWRTAGLDENAGRETWLNALRNSDYDVIYIDTFYNHRARPENQTPLTKEEVESLKTKPDGSRRQVIGYLSIGSAEQNRWYCQDDWVWVDPTNRNSTVSMKTGKATRTRQPDGSYIYSYSPYIPPEGEGPAPAWLSTGYGGNYPEEAVVQWWHPEWRDIIINGGGRYAHKTTGDNTSSIDRIINQGFDGVYLDNVGVYSRWQFDAYEQYWMNHGGIPGEVVTASPVDQELDYTEDPVDIPNPDRGFYRANDGMVVPVSGTKEDTMEVGADPVVVGGENGSEVQTRISHVYFDLRNFSSNAFTERGTRYTRNYRAPAGIPVKNDRTTYMVEPDTGTYTYVYEIAPDTDVTIYESHFDYWQKEVLPTWPKGTSQPLTEDALNYITDKFQQVRDGNGVTLVRFNYDGRGFGWVDCDHPVDGYVDRPVADIEPDKETLLTHIAQLKPILQEYEDVIMAVDGGMFGPWGEMHSTTFGTSPEAYAWLLDAWLDAVPESRSIIVQGGAFLSWYNNRYGTHYTFEDIDQIPAPERGTPEARFGFFNDSYAYGEDEGDNYPNDWGSLSEGAGWPGDPLGDEDSYDRGRVMTWIRRQNNFYGGEAQGDETLWNTYPFVAWEASYAQTVYLNADYEDSVHERWADFTYTEENVTQQMTNAYEEPYKTEYAIFDPVYGGKTGLEYWRDRLGYRLVLREASASGWVASNGTLEFNGKIQNVGFGNVVNQKDVAVILKNKASGKTYEVLTDLDARDWHPDLDSRATNTAAWRDLSFSIGMDDFGQLLPGEYEIYMKINDPKEQSENKRCIRFANKAPEGVDIWNEELGANLIGTTLVLAADTSDIALAKAAVEGAAYTAKQSQAGTEAKALAKIRDIIAKLDLKGVRASVNKVSYTAAVAGTSGNRSGTNGSYVFTVSLENDAASVVTRELTLTITATPYSSGSTGGGSTSSAADPVTASSSANGSVSIGSKAPQKGETVVITASPDEGYAVASITATDADGKKLSVTDNGDGTYSFVYEGKPVTIKATFAPVAAVKLPFTDVRSGDWFYDYVAYAYENKLMIGTADTRFSPDAELSRAMVATVLWRLAGEPVATASNPFSDLKENWYQSAVAWAYEKGIVTGYGNGLFGPEDPVTREQLVAMIGRYAKEFKGADISAAANLSGYQDINELSPYAYEYMSWACASGLIEGRSTSILAPGGTATRAEFAAILYRFIEK